MIYRHSFTAAAALLSLAATAEQISVASDSCSALGCLLLPRDVAFDNDARKALQRIRKQSSADAELVSSGNADQVTMTMMGYKGGRVEDQINQDRAFVMSPYLKENQTLLGVFDGHGNQGEVVAEYALKEVPKRLADKLNDVDNLTDSMVKKALTETFVEIDRSIPTNGQGGCTASVVLQLGHKIYVANVGDSQSLIATYTVLDGHVQVVYVTREDKPHLPEEHNRILSMGGSVHIPKDLELDSSRVLYTDPATGYQSGLAMSRSIGDWDMVGAIAEPIVDVLDLRQLTADAVDRVEKDPSSKETCIHTKHVHIYAISATDGMTDYTRPEELAESFAKALFESNGPHPLTTSEDLILSAAKGWNKEMDGHYRDDIAIAASKIALSQDDTAT